MTNNLTYLTKDQATQLLNNSCLCCKTRLSTRISSKTTTHESSDHGMCSEYERTVITSTIQELDVYLIQVQPPKFPGLDEKMKGVYSKFEHQIKENTLTLQQNLEAQLQMLPAEKQRVIHAAVQDSLKDLKQKQTRFPPYHLYSNLDTRVANLSDSLQFNDMQHQTLKDIQHVWTGPTSDAYNPGCLKTHIDCWPFKEKPTMEWAVISMTFDTLYNTIIQTPNFQNYPQHLEDAKEVLEWLKPQPINIAIKRYNPLDYMGRM